MQYVSPYTFRTQQLVALAAIKGSLAVAATKNRELKKMQRNRTREKLRASLGQLISLHAFGIFAPLHCPYICSLELGIFLNQTWDHNTVYVKLNLL